jgi:hypothetical protein
MDKVPNIPKTSKTPKISQKEDGLGMGYYILLIISLIFITYSITLVSMYASDTIDFNPDKSNWIWLSIGMIGLLGCFGMYFVLKPKSSKPDAELSTQTGQTPQIGQKQTQSVNMKESEQRRKLRYADTNYGSISELMNKSSKNTAVQEYGVIPFPSEYTRADPNLFKPSKQYDIAPPLSDNEQYGSVPRKREQHYGQISEKDVFEEVMKKNMGSLPGLGQS